MDNRQSEVEDYVQWHYGVTSDALMAMLDPFLTFPTAEDPQQQQLHQTVVQSVAQDVAFCTGPSTSAKLPSTSAELLTTFAPMTAASLYQQAGLHRHATDELSGARVVSSGTGVQTVSGICTAPRIMSSNFSINALLQLSPVAPSTVDVTSHRTNNSVQSTSCGGLPIYVDRSSK